MQVGELVTRQQLGRDTQTGVKQCEDWIYWKDPSQDKLLNILDSPPITEI